MGTIVNVIAIITGGCIGLACKRLFDDAKQASITNMLGLAITFIGVCGTFKSAFSIDSETMLLKDSGGLLVLCSLIIGILVGEYLNIDNHLNNIGSFVEKRLKLNNFALGFINASLIFCVGAMAIIGSLNDGILNDPSVLYLKSAIDCISAVMLCSTLGYGVVFSSISVGVYQGSLTLLAALSGSFISTALINNICLIGYILVSVIGLNFLKITNIKVANMLPALLVPIVLEVGMMMF